MAGVAFPASTRCNVAAFGYSPLAASEAFRVGESVTSQSMFNLLVVHGAVPFGYAPDMNDSDQHYDHHDLRHYHHLYHHHHLYRRDVTWERLHHTRDRLPLPDVIPSNTPPPSPLRRTRSCHAFFPETPPPSPQLPPTPPLTPATPRPGEGATGVAGENNNQVRRQVQGAEDPLPRAPPLPQLSWPLPSLPRRPHRPPAPREEGGEEEEERQRKWRYMGSDLRKIADQFQLTHAKARTKNSSKEEKKEKEKQQGGEEDEGEEDNEDDEEEEEEDEDEEQVEGAVSISIPAALSRCLSASLLLLVCWRLVSKY